MTKGTERPESPGALAEIAVVRGLLTSGRAKAIRIAALISLDEMAASIGVAASTICKWEAGVNIPRAAVAIRYGRVLKELARISDLMKVAQP